MEPHKECLAGSEFPLGTGIQNFCRFRSRSWAQNPQKLFADGEKDEGLFQKAEIPTGLADGYFLLFGIINRQTDYFRCHMIAEGFVVLHK